MLRNATSGRRLSTKDCDRARAQLVKKNGRFVVESLFAVLCTNIGKCVQVHCRCSLTSVRRDQADDVTDVEDKEGREQLFEILTTAPPQRAVLLFRSMLALEIAPSTDILRLFARHFEAFGNNLSFNNRLGDVAMDSSIVISFSGERSLRRWSGCNLEHVCAPNFAQKRCRVV
jgi:hypothetical protein